MALRRRSRHREDESFPGFTDVERIGAGGFSTVFSAREVETNRPVALKVLNLHDVSEHALGSFHRETFALGTLSAHPNIVTLVPDAHHRGRATGPGARAMPRLDPGPDP